MVQNMKTNPRIQVPLSPKTRKALQAMADASGSSLAAVCADILEQCAPVSHQMAKALQTARRAPGQAMKDALEALEAALAEGDQIRLDLSPKAKSKKKAG